MGRGALTLPPLCPSQPHFNKLMRRKWLSSPEALDGIVGTLGAQALALRRMQDEPYQVRPTGEAGEGGAARAFCWGRPLQGGEQLSRDAVGGAVPGVPASTGMPGEVQTGLGPLVGRALKNRERAEKDPFWGLVGDVP